MRKSQTGIEREDAKSSNDPLKLEYEDYLRNQRGLSERTIYHCWRFADRFLQFRFGGKARDLHKITPTDIVRFMQQLVFGKFIHVYGPSVRLRKPGCAGLSAIWAPKIFNPTLDYDHPSNMSA